MCLSIISKSWSILNRISSDSVDTVKLHNTRVDCVDPPWFFVENLQIEQAIGGISKKIDRFRENRRNTEQYRFQYLLISTISPW